MCRCGRGDVGGSCCVFGLCVCVCVLRHAEKTRKNPYVDSDTPPCVHSKRPRVCRQPAHMLKHTCAWCRHTRRRFGRTHGERRGRERGEEEGGVRRQPRVFIGKTSAFLTFVEHLNRTSGSSLIATFLLTMNGPRRVVTCPRGSPSNRRPF